MSESDDSVTSPDFMALYLILLLIVAISVTTFLILIYSNTTGGKASTCEIDSKSVVYEQRSRRAKPHRATFCGAFLEGWDWVKSVKCTKGCITCWQCLGLAKHQE